MKIIIKNIRLVKRGSALIKSSERSQKKQRIVRNSILKDSKITLEPIPRKPENRREEEKKQKNLTSLISKLEDGTVKAQASVLQHVDLEKEWELKNLEIMEYQKHLYPIIKIEMIIDEDELAFKETEEFIRTEILSYLRNIVQSFDDLLHPAYTKVIIEKEDPVQIQSQKNEDGNKS